MTTFPRRDGPRPWLLGHRGSPRRFTENTLSSFEAALAEGADGFELDVRLSRDGQLVVFHDPTLERLTQGRDQRSISDVTCNELEGIALVGGARIPTLLEVLCFAFCHDAKVNVELKADGPQPDSLCAALALLFAEHPELGRAGSLVFSSFSPAMLLEASRLGLPGPLAWLIESTEPFPPREPSILGAGITGLYPAEAHGAGITGLHPAEAHVTAKSLVAIRELADFVTVWTVNDPQRAQELADLGVDGLVSDEPGGIRGALTG